MERIYVYMSYLVTAARTRPYRMHATYLPDYLPHLRKSQIQAPMRKSGISTGKETLQHSLYEAVIQ